jgi:hypothetical protein
VWGRGFRAGVISAPEEADLLDAAQWTMSNKLAFDPAWVPATWQPPSNPGWLEGNLVETPSGEIWNILRLNATPETDQAAIVRVRDGGRLVTFDPADGFIRFPGGMTKFTIRRDALTGLYLTLSNPTLAPGVSSQRNVLALCVSRDLRHWEIKKVLLEDDSSLTPEESRRLTGFQYVDWQFDGEDLIYLVRTAYDGAHNYHDSNRITFHRLAHARAHLS